VCGAYQILTAKEAVVRLFPENYLWQVPEGGFESSSRIGPSAKKADSPANHRLAVRMNGDTPTFVSMRWRYEAAWMREKRVTVPINARSETMFSNGLFKHAARSKRCLIVVDGFYEPKGPKGTKRDQYLFTFPERRPFALAGLWTTYRGEDDAFEGFVICTTSANDQVGPIHARMPVMLTAEDEWDAWLQGNAEDARALCEPKETPELGSRKTG